LFAVFGTFEQKGGQVHHGGHVRLVSRLQIEIGCLVDVPMKLLWALTHVVRADVVGQIVFFEAHFIANAEVVEGLRALASLSGLFEVFYGTHEVFVVIEEQAAEIVLCQSAILIGSLFEKLPSLLNSHIGQLMYFACAKIPDSSGLVNVPQLREGLLVSRLSGLPDELKSHLIDFSVS